MIYVLYAELFMFSALFSSALHCFVYRKARKQSWFKGRSYCEQCKRDLSWWEIVPVFGGLISRGRCSSCKHYFGFHYTIMELLSGLAAILACMLAMNSMIVLAIIFIVCIILVNVASSILNSYT